MIDLYKYITTVLMLQFLLASCTNSDPSIHTPEKGGVASYKIVNYDSAILEIDKRLDTLWTYSEEVLKDPLFIAIYEHGSAYKNEALVFIENPTRSNQQIKACILSMQGLDLPDYLVFCNSLITASAKSMRPEYLLKTMIYPNFLQKKLIIDNYADAGVHKLLERLIGNPTISNSFKRQIRDIMAPVDTNAGIYYVFKNETHVQSLHIKDTSGQAIYFELTSFNTVQNKSSTLVGKASAKPNRDPEIDEDEDGNAYPAIEYLYTKGECSIRIRIELNSQEKARVIENKCSIMHNTDCPFASLGLLRRSTK